MTAPIRILAALVLLALGAGAALGQTWPDRPVRMIIPVAPGGAPDIIGRVLGQSLGTRLGQPVVVENRTGSNGNIAAELVARARPDGNTLLVGPDSLMTINPSLYARMPVNVLTELAPVASIAANGFVLAVSANLPARTLAEFLDLVRRADPPLAYASGGIGSQHHLAMEMLLRRAGARMLHVPYRGGSLAATAMVAGEAVAGFAGTSSVPLIQQGALRAIATTGPRRSATFPDLPTIGESFPGYEVTIWQGLFTTAGVPAPVIARLREEVHAALQVPEVRRRLEAGGGLEPFVTTPEEFAELIRSDTAKYRAVIEEIGLRAE